MTEAQLMADLIQLRRDTAANWTSANPTLSQGEQGYETDTGKMKIGDGSTAWSSLDYFVDSSAYATSSDITTAVTPKANTADLADVATSGSYDDLSDTPTIPSTLTDLSITDGTAGQVLSADGDGTYTFIDAASGGGGGGSFEAVASGSLANGDIVVVNSDGTVSVVAESGADDAIGSSTIFDNGGAAKISSTFDSNSNKVVVAYQNNSGQGTAVVGTVSGTSISFGTSVVFNTSSTTYIRAIFDSNSNKVVIAYRDGGNSGYGTAIVGTVSGTSISFGTRVVFRSSSTFFIGAAFDSNLNKVVISYRGDSSYGQAIVGTVSGTSISFGSAATFKSAGVNHTDATFDSNSNKVIIAYQDEGNSFYGTASVGTVSGTSISFGSSAVFESGTVSNISSTFDSNLNKIVIVYNDASDGGNGTASVGTVSGTSISFGTPVVYNAGNSTFNSVVFDSSANKVAISYSDGSNSSTGTIVLGTVSGTSISFGSDTTHGIGSDRSATFDSNLNKVVIAYRNSTGKGEGIVKQNQSSSTTLTAENYIGISDGAYSDGANATVQIVGSVDDAQSGLTPGKKYYVQTDGTLATTADDPSVFAGTAVATTKLIVKG